MHETRLADGFQVSAIGLGCSSMSHGYGTAERDDEESARVIHRAVELGINLFDTADAYGPFTNERLVGRTLRRYGESVHIATKCGLVTGPDGKFSRNGRPEYLRKACEASLQRLQVEVIDLYQLHRVDPVVPLAETWGALADLVIEGKVRSLGISHATCEELDQVHALFPITAVQYELSVWAPSSREDILPWCQKHNVGFLAFAPLGRGYLSGRVDPSALVPEDSRLRDPRFKADAVRTNQQIVDGIRRIGARFGYTPAQVAIAWTLAQGNGIVPIPGTRHRRWLEENVAALDLQLTPEALHEIDLLPSPAGEMSWDYSRHNGTRADISGAS
ncbi:aldo/keto reductase [Verrucosispora sp. SN26_14.1]|nr:aldo/keto reductase [Verrucosispora sp. SN26_14.1]TBL45500.1 aldo/keto reductase [Verrucosispora sp. SN26_14.1]